MKKSSTHCKPHYAPEALKGKDENKNKQGKFYFSVLSLTAPVCLGGLLPPTSKIYWPIWSYLFSLVMSCRKPNSVILHQTAQLTSGRYIWHDLRDHCIACVHRLWIILPHLFIRGHICRRRSISYKHEKIRINLKNSEYLFIHSTVVNTQK